MLSDIYMPDGGGLDLVKDIHEIDPAIPIILMTAQGSVEAAVRAMSEGATDFIGKPFDVAAVVELLRRHLGARREAESAQAPASIESADFGVGACWAKRADGNRVQANRTSCTERCTGTRSR